MLEVGPEKPFDRERILVHGGQLSSRRLRAATEGAKSQHQACVPSQEALRMRRGTQALSCSRATCRPCPVPAQPGQAGEPSALKGLHVLAWRRGGKGSQGLFSRSHEKPLSKAGGNSRGKCSQATSGSGAPSLCFPAPPVPRSTPSEKVRKAIPRLVTAPSLPASRLLEVEGKRGDSPLTHRCSSGSPLHLLEGQLMSFGWKGVHVARRGVT